MRRRLCAVVLASLLAPALGFSPPLQSTRSIVSFAASKSFHRCTRAERQSGPLHASLQPLPDCKNTRSIIRSFQRSPRDESSVSKGSHSNLSSTEVCKRVKSALFLLAAGLIVSGTPGPVLAEEETELAPPVLDQARTLTSKASARLVRSLEAFEEETGFRILVLTEDPQVVNKKPPEIKSMWALPDPKAVVVLLRPASGNILQFNYGPDVGKVLPDRFFGELRGRFGNQYNVQDVGQDGVVEETVKILETCLRREKGCFTVPGIGKDQYTATLASSLAGGVFFGFSLLTSVQFAQKEKDDREKARAADTIFKYSPVLFFPLWGLFFIGLGLNPLLQREADLQLVLQNVGAFSASAAATAAIYPRLLGVWSGYL